MKTAFFLVAPLLVSSIAFAQPETASPGQKVLRACANTYKSLREFKGSAAVVSQARVQVEKSDAVTMNQSADASFDFVRGNHFTINGHDASHQEFSIENTPQKTTTTWQLRGEKKVDAEDNLDMAVGGFTGVAVGAPTTVPALLMSSMWGFPFVTSDAATLKGTETFGGHKCFVVTQTSKSVPQMATYWIDAKSFLLRGMREEQSEWSFPMGMPGDVKPPATNPPVPQTKVLFSNAMHIFSIEKTLPTEEQLAANAKTVDIPQVGGTNN